MWGMQPAVDKLKGVGWWYATVNQGKITTSKQQRFSERN